MSFEPTLLSAGKSGTALAIRALAVSLLCGLLWLRLPRFAETGAAAAMLPSTLITLLLFRQATYRLARKNVDERRGEDYRWI